jgi:Ca2+-binding EF-hand superfamily protein
MANAACEGHAQVKEMLADVDADGSGEIEFDEFRRALA